MLKLSFKCPTLLMLQGLNVYFFSSCHLTSTRYIRTPTLQTNFLKTHSTKSFLIKLLLQNAHSIMNLGLTNRHLAKLVVDPLLSICLYSLFFMFNISDKDRGKRKLESHMKGSWHTIREFRFSYAFLSYF